jgi:hypothetical protein
MNRDGGNTQRWRTGGEEEKQDEEGDNKRRRRPHFAFTRATTCVLHSLGNAHGIPQLRKRSGV